MAARAFGYKQIVVTAVVHNVGGFDAAAGRGQAIRVAGGFHGAGVERGDVNAVAPGAVHHIGRAAGTLDEAAVDGVDAGACRRFDHYAAISPVARCHRSRFGYANRGLGGAEGGHGIEHVGFAVVTENIRRPGGCGVAVIGFPPAQAAAKNRYALNPVGAVAGVFDRDTACGTGFAQPPNAFFGDARVVGDQVTGKGVSACCCGG